MFTQVESVFRKVRVREGRRFAATLAKLNIIITYRVLVLVYEYNMVFGTAKVISQIRNIYNVHTHKTVDYTVVVMLNIMLYVYGYYTGRCVW